MSHSLDLRNSKSDNLLVLFFRIQIIHSHLEWKRLQSTLLLSEGRVLVDLANLLRGETQVQSRLDIGAWGAHLGLGGVR